jgi:hypothetical protein
MTLEAAMSSAPAVDSNFMDEREPTDAGERRPAEHTPCHGPD